MKDTGIRRSTISLKDLLFEGNFFFFSLARRLALGGGHLLFSS